MSRSLKIGGGEGEDEEATGEMISTTGAMRESAGGGAVWEDDPLSDEVGRVEEELELMMSVVFERRVGRAGSG